MAMTFSLVSRRWRAMRAGPSPRPVRAPHRRSSCAPLPSSAIWCGTGTRCDDSGAPARTACCGFHTSVGERRQPPARHGRRHAPCPSPRRDNIAPEPRLHPVHAVEGGEDFRLPRIVALPHGAPQHLDLDQHPRFSEVVEVRNGDRRHHEAALPSATTRFSAVSTESASRRVEKADVITRAQRLEAQLLAGTSVRS